MFSCCTRCTRPRADAGSPGRGAPGSPASPGPLSPGDEAEAGLLGAGADGGSPAAGCPRPRSVAAALVLVALAGTAAVGAVRHKHFAHSRKGDVLQMLEERAHGTMEAAHRKDQEMVPEKTLLGFLKDMERKKGAKSPEAEEAETKAFLTRFMVKIQTQHNLSRTQPRNKQARRKIDGFLKEMEQRQSKMRDQSHIDDSHNLSAKVHDFLEDIIAAPPGPPKQLHAAKEVGTRSPKVHLGRVHQERQVKGHERRNVTGTIDENSSSYDDRNGQGHDGGNVTSSANVDFSSREGTKLRGRDGRIVSSIADANLSSHDDANAQRREGRNVSLHVEPTSKDDRRSHVTTSVLLRDGVSVQLNRSSVADEPSNVTIDASASARARREREKLEDPDQDLPTNSSLQQHEGSCEAYGCMGYDTANTCQCNKRCKEYDNCCSDYAETCGALSFGQAQHRCEFYGCIHYEPSHVCQCNEGCSSYQDCCPDYRQQCTIALK